MGLHVLKFGGTSVGSLKRIELVASLLKERAKANQVVAVLSAMAGETDRLIESASYFTKCPVERELDMLLCTGEQRSVALMSICLQSQEVKAKSLLGSQIRIHTDSDHTRARIEKIDTEEIKKSLKEGWIVLVPGFQGMSPTGEITTLGRGGSDTSAVALAAALKADLCEIYTDVEGVYTTDPNIEPRAKKLNKITYDEMLELASLGAKVLQTRSVEFAKKYNVPIHVRSSFKNTPGTWVVEEVDPMESLVVSGITYTKNEAKLVVEAMPDRVGVAADLFGILGEAGIVVDVIIQNVSREGTTDISFTVPRDDLSKAIEVIESSKSILHQKSVKGDPHISKVSVIGNGMRSHSGVAAKMFKTLSDAGVAIQMISTSEIKISCVIDEKAVKEAVQSLHHAFGLDQVEAKEVDDFRS